MLFNLLTNFEHQYAENVALKTLLKSCGDHPSRQADLQRLLKNPSLLKGVHTRFDPLYAQINALDDAEAALELLSKFPIAGKPN
jgi:hypothetical protein